MYMNLFYSKRTSCTTGTWGTETRQGCSAQTQNKMAQTETGKTEFSLQQDQYREQLEANPTQTYVDKQLSSPLTYVDKQLSSPLTYVDKQLFSPLTYFDKQLSSPLTYVNQQNLFLLDKFKRGV